jgi:dipeptidyl-peptidase-3
MHLIIADFFAGFYANMGNYKGFGDSKFVPALPMERLELLILASEAAAQGPSIPALWQQVSVIQESSVADP